VAAPWDYICQLSTTKQNPICCCVTAGDITLSSPGRSGRTGRGEGGGTACERPVQLHALLSALLPRGENTFYQKQPHKRRCAVPDREGSEMTTDVWDPL